MANMKHTPGTCSIPFPCSKYRVLVSWHQQNRFPTSLKRDFSVLTVKLKLKDHETWITELLYLTLTQPDAPKASDTHLHIYVHTHTHTHTYTKCYLLPFLCHCYRAVINYLSMMSFRSPSPHTVQPSSNCTLAAILASIKSGMDTAKKQSSNADRNSCFVILTTSFL